MGETRDALPIGRWLPALIVFSLPGLLVLGGLVALGDLGVGPALVAGVVLVAGVGLAVRRSFGELWQVLRYALRLLREPDLPVPKPSQSLVAADLATAVERLHADLSAERRRLAAEAASGAAILDSLPDPLLLLDGERRVVRANAAARQLFGDALLGRDLAQMLRHPAPLDAVDEVLRRRSTFRKVEFALPGTVVRDFSARVVALPGPMSDRSVALLSLHDLTALKRTEQMRADFVANASHELRTPLTTLIGFIETLQGPARDDAEAHQRFLAIMGEQAQRMARLVGDLLSLSQIELDEYIPPEGRVDLVQVVQSVADMLQFQAKAKEMRIELEVEPNLPMVIGDRDQLIQVMQNLMDNALKYGRPGSPVVVGLRREPEALRVGGRTGAAVSAVVRDRGEGIPRENIPRLTERFYRVDTARSRALGGTGLGLAIVKHIVNRHRGSFTVESRIGEGSCFTVCLPAEKTG